jgi:hypothetical protein
LIQPGKAESGATVSVFALDIFHDLDQMTIPSTYSIQPSDIGNSAYTQEFLLSYTTVAGIKMSFYQGANSSITVTSKTNDIIEGPF